MRIVVPFLAATAVFLAASQSKAQLAQLPVMDGYPKRVIWPQEQNRPTVWTDGKRNQCDDSNLRNRAAFARFQSNVMQGSDSVAHEDPEFMQYVLPLFDIYHLHGSTVGYPDIFGDYVAFDTYKTSIPLDQNVFSFHFPSGALYDLSGFNDGRYDGRPSIDDNIVAWQTAPCLSSGSGCTPSSGIAYNHVTGGTRSEVYLGPDWSLAWPSVWAGQIVYDALETGRTGNQEGIGLFETSSHATFQMMSSTPPYRMTPHIANGRVVYQYRDKRNSPPSYSSILYMDLASWGSEVEPDFLMALKCDRFVGPRVGGEDGRYIVFTAVGCKDASGGIPYYALLLGDTLTDKVFLVDGLDYENDTWDHRVPYDIYNNVIVYVKSMKTHTEPSQNAIVYYEFDESSL